MSIHRNLMTVCFAAVFALGLAACSSSSDDDPPEVAVTPTEPESDPSPTDLETTQAAAAAAAAAAMTASTNADASASGAEAATASSATLQTGEMAMMYAMGARESADEAMAEYMKAKAASEAAAAATTASAAGRALENAEAAQAAAEAAAGTASEKAMKAADAAKMELMIDGTMKSVGDTTVDAAAPNSEVTTGTGAAAQKAITGLLPGMEPEGSAKAVTGIAYREAADADDASTTDVDETKEQPYVQAVAARDDIKLGKVVDSSDDMARLMIITKYVGKKSVRVFADAADAGNFSGTVQPDGSIETAAGNVVTLKPVSGTYYQAGTNDGNDGLTHEDVVTFTSKTKGRSVFAFTNNNNTPNDATDDTTGHVVLISSTPNVDTGDTTNSYRAVDIDAPAAPDDPTVTADTDPEEIGVKAKVPDGAAYSHVHFGVWAGLSEAKASGAQSIADLGIGFVQSVGDGMTGSDMPNNGTASYSGNWAATIQGEDPDGDGDISLESGPAMLSANFNKSEITVTLTGLATLEGDISGNTFSGSKATESHDDLSGTFTGSFGGGFYGSQAAETAGIFDFASKDNVGGAFRGAVGGKKQAQ